MTLLFTNRSTCVNKLPEYWSHPGTGEVYGANKPLDPNYKPEHQSKSKLPSVTVKSSRIKTPKKPILKMPTRPTPKVLTTPKSVKIQSETENDMLTPIPNPTIMGTPVSVHGGAWPKTHGVDGTPLIPPQHSLLLLNCNRWC